LQDLYRQWRVLLERGTPQLLRKFPDRPYHPHLTLAHRDVTPEQFRPIWNHFKDKSFDASFEVTGFWILNNTTSGWEPETEFQFSAP
jgi:2'-5' RNA ligase